MPKNTKKKKDKVTDFTKAKLKLGKGKSQPTNAVDTSFKARSIALPTQSITIEKDSSEPLTKRHLAFSDLILHLKHHNAGTRRDAILGLKELLDSNPELINSHLTPLLSALVRLIGDEDASVRKQFISFFAWLVPHIPKDDLVPHSTLLILFTTSAQTHIFPEIRIDAIRVLDILLECIPEAVTAGWSDRNEQHGGRVLGGYLGILNAGTRYGDGDSATSTAGVVLTLASKLIVLRSLATFLRICLSPEGTTPDSWNKPLDGWFTGCGFSSSEAFQSYNKLFTPERQSREPQCIYRYWQKQVDPDDEEGDQFVNSFPLLQGKSGEPWTLNDLSLLDSNDLTVSQEHYWSSQSSRPEFVAHLARTLHSTIIETYLDCAPSVFSPGSSPPETELRLVSTVIQIAQCMYRYIIQSLQDINALHIEHLREVVNHMAPYFPASNGRDTKTEQALEEFNLSFCFLTSLLLKASETSPSLSLHSTQTRRHPKRNLTSFFHVQTTRVTEYIARRLSGSSVSSSITVPITPIAYVTLLPSIWTFISNLIVVDGKGGDKGGSEESNDLLHAVLDHAVQVPSKSPCKRATVEFVGKLFLLDTSPHYLGPNLLRFGGNPDFSLQAKLEAWLLHLPQVLWELGSSNISLTEVILRVLLRTLQRRFNHFPRLNCAASRCNTVAAVGHGQNDTASASKNLYHTLISLESRLVPYFFINHPTHGALAGPFKKLSNTSESSASMHLVGFLALDVAATILEASISGGVGKEAEALEKAVSLSLTGESTVAEMREYWEHVVLVMKRQDR